MTDKIKLEVTSPMYKSFTGERKYTLAKYYTFYNFIKHKTTLQSDKRYIEAYEAAKKKFTSADEKELMTRAFYDLQDSNLIEFSVKDAESVMHQFIRARASTNDVARKAAEEKVLKVVSEGEITYNTWDFFFTTIDKLEVVSEDLEPQPKFTTYNTLVDPTLKDHKVATVVHNTIRGVTSHTCNFLESNKQSALSSVLVGSSFDEITNSIHLASCIHSICFSNYTVKTPEEFMKHVGKAKCKPLIANQLVMNMLWLFRNYLILRDDKGNKFKMSCDMASTDLNSIDIYNKMENWANGCNDVLVCLLCIFVKNAGHSNIFVDVPNLLSADFLKKYEEKCWRKSLYSYVTQAANSLLGTNGVYDENVRVINTKTYFERLAMYRDYAQTTALLNCLMFVPKRNVITSSSERIKIKNSNPKPFPIEDHGTVPARTLIMWGVVEGLISACPDNAESCAKTMGVVVLPDKCLVTLSNKGKLSVRVGEKSFVVLSAENINPHDLSLHLSSLASFQDPKTLYITPSVIVSLIRSTVYNLIKSSVGAQEKKGVADLLKKFRTEEGYFKYNICDSSSSQLEQIIYSFHHFSPNFVYSNLIKCGNWSLKPETIEDLTNYLIGTSCLLLIEHSTLLASRCGLRKKVAGYEDTVKKIKEAQEKYHTIKTMSDVSGSGGDSVVAAQNELINALYKDKKKETISMLYSLTTYGQTGKFNNLAIGFEPDWVDTFNKLVAVERSTVELAVSTNDGFAQHVLDGGSDSAAKQCVITSTLCTNAMSASPFVITYDTKFLGGGYSGIRQVTNIGNVTNYNCSPLDSVHISESYIVKTSKEAGTAMITDKDNTYSHDEAIKKIYSIGKSRLVENLVKWTKNKEISSVIRGLKPTPVPELKESDMVTVPDIYAKFAAPGTDSITVKVGELSFSFDSSYASLYSMYKGEELKSNVVDAIKCGKLDESVKNKMSSIVHAVQKTSKGMSNAIEVLGLSMNPLIDVTKGQSEEFCASWINLILTYRRLDFGVLATLLELSKVYVITKSMWLAVACLDAYKGAGHSQDFYHSLSELEFIDNNTVADKENTELMVKCAKLFDHKGVKSKKVKVYFSEGQFHQIANSVGGSMSAYNTAATMKGFLKSKAFTDAVTEMSKKDPDLSSIDSDLVDFIEALNSDFPVHSDKYRDLVVSDLDFPGWYISYSYDCYCKVINVFTDAKGERLKGCYIPKVKFQLVDVETANKLASDAISKSSAEYAERVKTLTFSAGTDPTAFKSKILKMSLIKEKGSFETKPGVGESVAAETNDDSEAEGDAKDKQDDEQSGAATVDTQTGFPPPPPPPPAPAAADSTGSTDQSSPGGNNGSVDQTSSEGAKKHSYVSQMSKTMHMYPELTKENKSLTDAINDLISVSADNDDTKEFMRKHIELAEAISNIDIDKWGKEHFDVVYPYAANLCNMQTFEGALELGMTQFAEIEERITSKVGIKQGDQITLPAIAEIVDVHERKVKGTDLESLYGRVMLVLFACVLHGYTITSEIVDEYIKQSPEGVPISYSNQWYVAMAACIMSYFSANLSPTLTFLKDHVHQKYDSLFVSLSSKKPELIASFFKESVMNFTVLVCKMNEISLKPIAPTRAQISEVDRLAYDYVGLLVLPGLRIYPQDSQNSKSSS